MKRRLLARMKSPAGRIAYALALAGLAGLIALPAIGLESRDNRPAPFLSQVSQSVAFHRYLHDPSLAPAGLRGEIAGLRQRLGARPGSISSPAVTTGPSGDRFNKDVTGLPQNEESVSVCQPKPSLVISGTNDYRGLLDPDGNFTGWYWSTNGGGSVAKEGLLPTVTVGSPGNNVERPSGGDPSFATQPSGGTCDIYAASINYDPTGALNSNGVGVYKTTPSTLNSASCSPNQSNILGGSLSDASCWPTRRYAAFTGSSTQFLDKEWIDVGNTGDGVHVWVVWSLYSGVDVSGGFTSAKIQAARCTANLSSCDSPVDISTVDNDVSFADVTIGADHKTYITWAAINGELVPGPQTFTIKSVVIPASSETPGAEHTVFHETKAIPFTGFLQGNDFRVATYPKSTVKTVNGSQRFYVVWDACQARLLDDQGGGICENPLIKFRFSNNGGATWSPVKVLSTGGDNYFPWIDADPLGPNLAVAYYTSRHDPFRSDQDVELVTLSKGGTILKRQRVTSRSNEPGADPLIGEFFIGDYFQVAARAGTAYVAYNANYTAMKLLGAGIPVNQQDNFLHKKGM